MSLHKFFGRFIQNSARTFRVWAPTPSPYALTPTVKTTVADSNFKVFCLPNRVALPLKIARQKIKVKYFPQEKKTHFVIRNVQCQLI